MFLLLVFTLCSFFQMTGMKAALAFFIVLFGYALKITGLPLSLSLLVFA